MERLSCQHVPLRFEYHDLAPGYTFDALPVRLDPNGVVLVFVHNADPVPGYENSVGMEAGKSLILDFDCFQDLTWEPIEVDDYDWRQHLS